MMSAARVIAYIALVWAFAVASVSGEAVRRWRKRRRIGPIALPADVAVQKVLVVRPCAGNEPRLEQTLASLALAHRSFDVRCVFALEGPEDPAFQAAEKACSRLQAAYIDARIVFTRAQGPNRKAAQLAAWSRELAKTDVLIVADSDVDLAHFDLDALVGSLGNAVWAAWAPPVEVGLGKTMGDRGSAAVFGASLHAFPLLAGLDPTGFVGKTFAIRRDALARIGGFGALTEYLGEDVEISRRIREKGGLTSAVPVVTRSLAEGRTLADVNARFARWLTVIRAQRPWLLISYPALFCATPLIVLLSAVSACAGEPALSIVAAAVAVVVRLGVAAIASIAVARRPSFRAVVVDAALADAVLAAAFVRAIVSRTVIWRNQVLIVDRAGVLRRRTKQLPNAA